MSFKESVVHVYTKPRKGVPSNHCLVIKGLHSFYSGHFYLKTLLVWVLLVENCFKISWLQCSFFSTVNWSTLLVRVGARHSLQLISGDARLWMFSSLALIFKRYYTKFLLHFPSCLMPMNLKRLLTALQNLRSDKTCPNAEFMEYMTKRRIKLSSWSWAGSAMNRTTSIRRYWDIRMNNELSLHGPRFESEVKLKSFFACLPCRFQMNCWSMPKLLPRLLLRRWMPTKRHDDLPKLGVFGGVDISDPFGGDPLGVGTFQPKTEPNWNQVFFVFSIRCRFSFLTNRRDRLGFGFYLLDTDTTERTAV